MHTDFDVEPWWQIDLEGSFNIARIEIYNREDCCAESLSNFHVFVSDTPFQSTSIAATIAQPGVTDIAHPGTAGRTTVLNVGRTGRFVRVQLTASDYLQLAEVEIIGTPAAGGPTNLPPTLINPGDQATLVDQAVGLALQASDVESDPLTFSATGLPPGLSISSTTGSISGAPTTPGGFAVVASVSDGTSSTDVSFSWTVTTDAIPENLAVGKVARQSSDFPAPIDLSAAKAVDGNSNGNFGASSLSHTGFDANPFWEVDLGTNYSVLDVRVYNREDCCAASQSQFYVLVSDTPIPDGDVDTVRATPGVSGYYVDGVAGRPSTINVNRSGRYVRIQLTRADYLQLAEVEVFGVPITGTTNFAPALANPGEQTSSLNQPVDLLLSATDPDGDLLSFSATGLPPGVSIESSTGAISGSATAAGTFNVQASVTDGVETTSISFSWTVFDGLPPTNLALGGTAQQSSDFANLAFLGAHKANDGNRAGDFGAGSLTHTDNDNEAWWQVDLGAVYDLQRVELYNRSDCCAESLSNFYVLVSDQPFGNASLAQLLGNSAVRAYAVPGAAGPDEIIQVPGHRALRARATGRARLSATRRGRGVRHAHPVNRSSTAQNRYWFCQRCRHNAPVDKWRTGDTMAVNPARALSGTGRYRRLLAFVVTTVIAWGFAPGVTAADRYWVSLGSFSELAGAEQLRDRALASFPQIGVVPAESPVGFVYRVVEGPLPTRESADALLVRARDMGFVDAWVVVLDEASETLSSVETLSSAETSGYTSAAATSGLVRDEYRSTLESYDDSSGYDAASSDESADFDDGYSALERSEHVLVEEAPPGYGLHRLHRDTDQPRVGASPNSRLRALNPDAEISD